MYIVQWKLKSDNFINKEYCLTLEEALRWKISHEKSKCEFCHISDPEKEHKDALSPGKHPIQ